MQSAYETGHEEVIVAVNRPDEFSGVWRWQAVPLVIVLVMPFCAGIGIFVSTSQYGMTTPTIVTTAILILLGVVFTVANLRRTRIIAMERFVSLRIVVDDVGVTGPRLDLDRSIARPSGPGSLFRSSSATGYLSSPDTITIPFSRIENIYEAGNGTLRLRGETEAEQIQIPRTLDRFDDVRDRIHARILPETIIRKEQATTWRNVVLTILVVAAMAVAYISKDRYIVTATGAVFIIAIGFSLVSTWRSRLASKATKRLMLFTLIPASSVIMKIIAVWRQS